jgi:hypothetical protein
MMFADFADFLYTLYGAILVITIITAYAIVTFITSHAQVIVTALALYAAVTQCVRLFAASAEASVIDHDDEIELEQPLLIAPKVSEHAATTSFTTQPFIIEIDDDSPSDSDDSSVVSFETEMTESSADNDSEYGDDDDDSFSSFSCSAAPPTVYTTRSGRRVVPPARFMFESPAAPSVAVPVPVPPARHRVRFVKGFESEKPPQQPTGSILRGSYGPSPIDFDYLEMDDDDAEILGYKEVAFGGQGGIVNHRIDEVSVEQNAVWRWRIYGKDAPALDDVDLLTFDHNLKTCLYDDELMGVWR